MHHENNTEQSAWRTVSCLRRCCCFRLWKTSMTKKSNAELLRLGKDEMNLVEFPITLLTDRPDPGQNVINYELPFVGKNGKIERAKVQITGSEIHGLPIAGDMDV